MSSAPEPQEQAGEGHAVAEQLSNDEQPTSNNSPAQQLDNDENQPQPVLPMPDRRGLFVRRRSISKDKAEIINEYHHRHSDLVSKADLVTRDVSLPNDTFLDRYNRDALIHEEGFAAPRHQRALPVEEEALRKFTKLRDSGDIEGTEKEWALFLEQEIANDGFSELSREYAQGQRMVPVELLNREKAEKEALRYDSTVEEARLRKKLLDLQKSMESELDDFKKRGMLEIEDEKAEHLADDAAQRAHDLAEDLLHDASKLEQVRADKQESDKGNGTPRTGPSIQEAYATLEIAFREQRAADRAMGSAEDEGWPERETTLRKSNSQLQNSLLEFASSCKRSFAVGEWAVLNAGTNSDDEDSRGDSSTSDTESTDTESTSNVPEILYQKVAEACIEIKRLVPELARKFACREATRHAIRAEALERNGQGETDWNIRAIRQMFSPKKPAVTHKEYDEANRQRWAMAHRLRWAEQRVQHLEETIKDLQKASNGDEGVDIEKIRAYRTLVANHIRKRLESEGRRKVKDQAVVISHRRNLDIMRQYLLQAATKPPTPEELHRLQKAIDEMSADLDTGLAMADELLDCMESIAHDVGKDGLTVDLEQDERPRWQLADLRAALEAKTTKLNELQSEVETLRAHGATEDDAAPRQEALMQAQSLWEVEKGLLRRDLEQAREREQKSRQLAEDLDKFAESLLGEIRSMKDPEFKSREREVESLKVGIAKQRNQVRDREQKIAELEAEVKTAHDKIAVMVQADRDRESAQASGEIGNASPEALSQTVINLNERNGILELEIRDRERWIVNLENHLRSSNTETLEAEIRMLEEARFSLEDIVEGQNTNIEELMSTKRQLQERVKLLEMGIENLKDGRDRPVDTDNKASAGDHESASLEQRIQGLEREVESLNEQLSKTSEERDRFLRESEEEFRLRESNASQLNQLWDDFISLQARHGKQKLLLATRIPKGAEVPALNNQQNRDRDRRRTWGDEIESEDPTPNPESDGTFRRQEQRIPLVEMNRMLSSLVSEAEDGIRCGTDGAFRVAGSNKEVSPELATAWMHAQSFLQHRASIVRELRDLDIEKADIRYEQLCSWMKKPFDGPRHWGDYFDWIDVTGSIIQLRARILADFALDLWSRANPDWKSLAGEALAALEDFSDEMQQHRPANPDGAQQSLSSWEIMGQKTLDKIKEMQNSDLPSDPKCKCRFKYRPCRVHNSGPDESKAPTALHNLILVPGSRDAEVLVDKELMDDLAPTSIPWSEEMSGLHGVPKTYTKPPAALTVKPLMVSSATRTRANSSG